MEDVKEVKNSEDIIADLINDVKASDKPFAVDKIAGLVVSETNKADKKHKKHKKDKHKKSKKKKSSRSRSHKSRSRSKSPSRKHKKRRKRNSSSSSSSAEEQEKIPVDPFEPKPCQSEVKEEIKEKENKEKEEVVLKPLVSKNEEDDFKQKLLVKKDTKLSINIKTVFPKEEEAEEGEIVENEKKNEKKSRKRSRSREKHRDRDKDRDRDRDRRRSSRSPNRRDNRGRGDDREKTSRRRTPSRENRRGRITRFDSDDRRRRSSRSMSRSRRRDRRSRSREYIDKVKLLEIAKKNRARMYVTGEQRTNATVEDFVTYCQRLQKRQEKEKRREKGEAVSSDDDSDTEAQYKHPYALPSNNPIRINIVTSATATLAQKALMAPEEKVLGPSELRVLFPVSSGAVHKENAEWIPVPKDDVPKSCTNEQKKHVAMTSSEIERCKLAGIPIPEPPPVPKFLNSILPPPPPPPPEFGDEVPVLPQVLYLPPKERMIIKEPVANLPSPQDLSETLRLRVDAQRRIARNSKDYVAHYQLAEANERMEAWAALKSLPGEYTGSTGLKLLTADELQPDNPKYHAWVKRDQFKKAAPQLGGVGQRLMEKMGWKPGEGLGKEADGNLEPLTLDVKSDRKGLMAEEEMTMKQRNKLNGIVQPAMDLSTKNPISVLMEICSKRRWPPPQFNCEEFGRDANRQFIWTVVVNNAFFRPMGGSKSKKEGKAVVAQVALQSMGFIPRDPDLPVCM